MTEPHPICPYCLACLCPMCAGLHPKLHQQWAAGKVPAGLRKLRIEGQSLHPDAKSYLTEPPVPTTAVFPPPVHCVSLIRGRRRLDIPRCMN